MDSRSISRRLDILQQIARRNKPLKVKVLFTDGNVVTTDQSGALGLLQELGPRGEIDSFQSDGPMSEWARLLTILLHPRENREISDYE